MAFPDRDVNLSFSGFKPRVRTELILFFLAVTCVGARAWGPLGHRMVAETAARLVERDLPDGWG